VLKGENTTFFFDEVLTMASNSENSSNFDPLDPTGLPYEKNTDMSDVQSLSEKNPDPTKQTNETEN
jgi:hypothetical protein